MAPAVNPSEVSQLPEPQTLFSAYKEIIPAVIKKSKNPDYFIPVKVPNN